MVRFDTETICTSREQVAVMLIYENLKIINREIRKIIFAMGYYCTFVQNIFVRFLNSYPELKHKYFPSLLGMGDAELQNSPRLKVNFQSTCWGWATLNS